MIRNFFIFIFLVFGILVFEIIGAYNLHLAVFMPDLLIIFLIYISLVNGVIVGETIGFFLGIIRDVFGVGIFGTSAFLFSIIGYVIGNMSHSLDEESMPIQIILTVFSSYFYLLGFYLIQIVFGYNFRASYSLFIFFKPFISAFIVPFIFFVFLKFNLNVFGSNNK